MVKYRTEQLYGTGYRDLKEVISFEIFELENDDIPLTILSLLKDECKVKASEDLRNMIKSLLNGGLQTNRLHLIKIGSL